MNFVVDKDEKRATIHDFYVIPEERRRGHASAMVSWLFKFLDKRGIERIDLNVRRDNPTALAFWQSQGFGITAYRLRQYRDPKTGTAYTGVLSSDF
jgi:ribosomal protein S18 acetylase RimI-like enzyme